MARAQTFSDGAARNCAYRGLTVGQTAAELGVHPGTVTRWRIRNPGVMFRDGRGAHLVTEQTEAEIDADRFLRVAQRSQSRADSPLDPILRLAAAQRCFRVRDIDAGTEGTVGVMMEQVVWRERRRSNRLLLAQKAVDLDRDLAVLAVTGAGARSRP